MLSSFFVETQKLAMSAAPPAIPKPDVSLMNVSTNAPTLGRLGATASAKAGLSKAPKINSSPVTGSLAQNTGANVSPPTVRT